jgi:hypothetical protein
VLLDAAQPLTASLEDAMHIPKLAAHTGGQLAARQPLGHAQHKYLAPVQKDKPTGSE